MNRLSTALTAVLFVWPGLIWAQSEAERLLQEGIASAKAQQWQQAAAILRRGEKRFPNDNRFPVELAGIAYRQKKKSVAKQELRRALQLSPADTYANDFLGTIYFEDGNLAAALTPWNRIGKPMLAQIVFSPVPAMQPLLRERAVPLAPGQLLTKKGLLATTDNLERLNVLAGLRLELVPQQGDNFDLVIQTLAVGGPLGGWPGRLLPFVRELPYQAVAPDFLNLSEAAINVRTLFRWDPNKRRALLTVESPWQKNPRIHEEYSVDLRDETWLIPGVTRILQLRRGEVRGGFTFALQPELHWSVGGRVDDRMFTNAPGQAAFHNGYSAAIDNRLQSDWLLARTRWSGSEFVSFSAERFAGSRVLSTRIGAAARWLPGARQEKLELFMQTQAGRTAGPVPLDEQFSLGTERDTEDDLWLRGIAGATNGRKGNGPIGTAYALVQADVQRSFFEIPFVRFGAGPFFDAGTVGHPLSASIYRGTQYDAGIEAKIRTVSDVTVELIYGRNLADGGSLFYTAVRRTLR